MARYVKITTVVDAEQSGSVKNWGELGNLVTTDWIILTADNQWHTMNDATFTAKYVLTSPSSPLTGTDWD